MLILRDKRSIELTVNKRKSSLFVVIKCRYNFKAHLSSCEVSLLLCVFCVSFSYTVVVISFSLHAMLPLLANNDEYKKIILLTRSEKNGSIYTGNNVAVTSF